MLSLFSLSLCIALAPDGAAMSIEQTTTDAKRAVPPSFVSETSTVAHCSATDGASKDLTRDELGLMASAAGVDLLSNGDAAGASECLVIAARLLPDSAVI